MFEFVRMQGVEWLSPLGIWRLIWPVNGLS